MPFLPPNQQRQSTEGKHLSEMSFIISVDLVIQSIYFVGMVYSVQLTGQVQLSGRVCPLGVTSEVLSVWVTTTVQMHLILRL